MIVGEKLDSSTNKKKLYSSVEYQGYTYKVGGGCFLNPDTYNYRYNKNRKSTYKDLSSKVITVSIDTLNYVFIIGAARLPIYI